MDKASLIAFWEECAKDPVKRAYFHKVFGEYLRTLADTPPEAPTSPVEPSKGTWTDNQRKAFHVGCEELANYFVAHGLDMKAVLKHDVDIPWTKESVKEFIFRPIMKAMYGYESHTELKKIEEVSQLWNVAMKHLGERRYTNKEGEEVVIEHMDFPNDKDRGNDLTKARNIASKMEYPEDIYPDGPNFDV